MIKVFDETGEYLSTANSVNDLVSSYPNRFIRHEEYEELVGDEITESLDNLRTLNNVISTEYRGLIAVGVKEEIPGFYISEGITLLPSSDFQKPPTIEGITPEGILKARVEAGIININKLCEEKLEAGKLLLLGVNNSDYIKEEYQEVSEALADGNVEFFETEAVLLGTAAQEEFDKATEAKALHLALYTEFLQKIRGFRRKAQDVARTGDLEGVVRALEAAKEFSDITTIDEIQAAFA